MPVLTESDASSCRIVFLNGTSCSGKSTTAIALHRSMDAPWFLIDIDHFLAGRPVWDVGWQSESVQRRLYTGFHRAVASFAEADNDIILATIVPWHDPAFMAELVGALEPFRVLFVGVRCPLDVLEERALRRPDVPLDRVRAQFDQVHRYGPYDVEVDTSRLAPEECAQVIRDRVESAPAQAFARLKGRLGSLGGWSARRYPTVGVAVLLVEDGRVLLVRRKFGARAGQWCVPCGHVEWEEDVRDAALRELEEETGLRARIDAVYEVQSNSHDPDLRTVGIWFRATRTGGDLQAGGDADDARWFFLDSLPETLAFPTDRLVLERLSFESRLTGQPSD